MVRSWIKKYAELLILLGLVCGFVASMTWLGYCIGGAIDKIAG